MSLRYKCAESIVWSIDAINKIQYKNSISNLNRLVFEKSEIILHLEQK